MATELAPIQHPMGAQVARKRPANQQARPLALDTRVDAPHASLLGRLCGVPRVRALYEAIADAYDAIERQDPAEEAADAPPSFPAFALDHMKVAWHSHGTELATITQRGRPLVVVANHPMGAIDGLALLALLLKVRPDVRILGNALLLHMPRMAEWVIPLELDGTERAAALNLAALRNARRWLSSGGCLLSFPAGEVARFTWRRLAVVESSWSPHLVRLAQASRADVLPVHIEGHNRWRFHAAGMLSRSARSALLGREMLAYRGKSCTLRVGKLVDADKVWRLGPDVRATQALRLRTCALGAQAFLPRACGKPATPSGTRMAQIAPPRGQLFVGQDVAELPPEALLLRLGHYAVYVARAAQIPNLMHELGRQRELAFRAVGEGTGRSLDLDTYDGHYHHLFVWDERERALAGAYRLGLCDDILRAHGVAGLYSHTLFDYGPSLLRRIEPAIELGRSFVALPYQRSPQGLYLLWRGIGTFLSRHPHYRRLFGPVTISPHYSRLSQNLLVSFLCETLGAPELSPFVMPRQPIPPTRRAPDLELGARAIEEMQTLSELISHIEPDRKRAPILVEHYARLGGRFIDATIDPAFSNAVDALVLVDLDTADPATLARYMGKEGYRDFCVRQRRDRPHLNLAPAGNLASRLA